MTPNTDERIASVIRALTEVILPHLPPEASLAQEQVQLAIGHLQILRLQLDAIPGFEAEELADRRALAEELAATLTGGAETDAALGAVRAALADGRSDVRAALTTVNLAIEKLVQAVSIDGAADAKPRLFKVILDHEGGRVEKDRRWFLPYGFDTMEPAQ